MLNLDIFPIQNAEGVSRLCNLKQFSFPNIQTLNNDCSYIEDVHLLFCTHFIILFFILGILNLDIFPVKCVEGVWFV